MRDVLFRAIKKFHPDSNSKALVLNTCYNMEWYETYLRKEEDCIDVDTEVDTDNFDAELFRSQDSSSWGDQKKLCRTGRDVRQRC